MQEQASQENEVQTSDVDPKPPFILGRNLWNSKNKRNGSPVTLFKVLPEMKRYPMQAVLESVPGFQPLSDGSDHAKPF